ncbi:GNAT family N-acetyltransferase [Luteococcus sp. Sow4_B9]|uniref:GNAT family N-acetyltransferase n=1 Tax=Luteococcus sp. Sow4_B9 TaxID=3438792 RepID=UPI003F96CD3C
MPEKEEVPDLRIKALGPEDRHQIGEVLLHDGGFSVRVNGRPSGAGDVDALLSSRPPGTSTEQLHPFGCWDADILLGLAIVLLDWPDPGTNWLGLLQVHEEHVRRGVGRRLHETLLTRCPASRWQLAVVDSNAQALGFWERLGYRRTGEQRPWTSPSGEERRAIILELVPPA